MGYCRAAVAQLQRLEWDLWINEFSAFAPLRVPAALRQQGLLLFYHFMGRHALVKHPLVGGVAWLCERRALRAYDRILTIAPSVQARIQRRARATRRSIWCTAALSGAFSRWCPRKHRTCSTLGGWIYTPRGLIY